MKPCTGRHIFLTAVAAIVVGAVALVAVFSTMPSSQHQQHDDAHQSSLAAVGPFPKSLQGPIDTTAASTGRALDTAVLRSDHAEYAFASSAATVSFVVDTPHASNTMLTFLPSTDPRATGTASAALFTHPSTGAQLPLDNAHNGTDHTAWQLGAAGSTNGAGTWKFTTAKEGGGVLLVRNAGGVVLETQLKSYQTHIGTTSSPRVLARIVAAAAAGADTTGTGAETPPGISIVNATATFRRSSGAVASVVVAMQSTAEGLEAEFVASEEGMYTATVEVFALDTTSGILIHRVGRTHTLHVLDPSAFPQPIVHASHIAPHAHGAAAIDFVSIVVPVSVPVPVLVSAKVRRVAIYAQVWAPKMSHATSPVSMATQDHALVPVAWVSTIATLRKCRIPSLSAKAEWCIELDLHKQWFTDASADLSGRCELRAMHLRDPLTHVPVFVGETSKAMPLAVHAKVTNTMVHGAEELARLHRGQHDGTGTSNGGSIPAPVKPTRVAAGDRSHPHHAAFFFGARPAAFPTRTTTAAAANAAGAADDSTRRLRVLGSSVSTASSSSSSNSAANNNDGTASLLGTHGYCSTEIWPETEFTDAKYYGSGYHQGISNDAFARQLWNYTEARGMNEGGFSIVAHSQGGLAALHLYANYWTGLDNVLGKEKGRLIQSAGSPYQGTHIMTSIGFLNKLLACGTVHDLSPDGGKQWLATIPVVARNEVYFYRSWCGDDSTLPCDWRTRILLDKCNDGVTECGLDLLPGGHDMGLATHQCHTSGLHYPPIYADKSRNAILNANAARPWSVPS